jgi:hypothetical protein
MRAFPAVEAGEYALELLDDFIYDGEILAKWCASSPRWEAILRLKRERMKFRTAGKFHVNEKDGFDVTNI